MNASQQAILLAFLFLTPNFAEPSAESQAEHFGHGGGMDHRGGMGFRHGRGGFGGFPGPMGPPFMAPYPVAVPPPPMPMPPFPAPAAPVTPLAPMPMGSADQGMMAGQDSGLDMPSYGGSNGYSRRTVYFENRGADLAPVSSGNANVMVSASANVRSGVQPQVLASQGSSLQRGAVESRRFDQGTEGLGIEVDGSAGQMPSQGMPMPPQPGLLKECPLSRVSLLNNHLLQCRHRSSLLKCLLGKIHKVAMVIVLMSKAFPKRRRHSTNENLEARLQQLSTSEWDHGTPVTMLSGEGRWLMAAWSLKHQ